MAPNMKAQSFIPAAQSYEIRIVFSLLIHRKKHCTQCCLKNHEEDVKKSLQILLNTHYCYLGS